jgi:hypothetical protein
MGCLVPLGHDLPLRVEDDVVLRDTSVRLVGHAQQSAEVRIILSVTRQDGHDVNAVCLHLVTD